MLYNLWLRSRRAVRVALFGAAALLLTSSVSRAEFLSNYTGNTQTTNGGGLDGTYNFAVLDQQTSGIKGNEWGAVVNPAVTGTARYDPSFDKRFVAGTGSAGLDTGARYLYMLQIVNNGIGTNALQTVSLSLDPSLITSFGYFGKPGQGGVGGNDNLGAVDFNNNLGTDGLHFDGLAHTGVKNPAIVALNDGTSVAPQDVTVSLTNGQLMVTFPTNELAQGNRSVLVGFTSDYAPGIAPGNVFSFDGSSGHGPEHGHGPGFGQAFGQAPIPMPEPSAYALMGVGVGCIGLILWRRRKAAPTLATA
jgi:hypothetical protein